MNIYEAQRQLRDTQERLEREIAIKQKALEWIEYHADCYDESEEIDMNEVYRAIEEEAEYNYQRAEENSLYSAWQQDLIDLYRRER